MVAELTPDDVGDVSVVPDLLEQVDSRGASLIADGALPVWPDEGGSLTNTATR